MEMEMEMEILKLEFNEAFTHKSVYSQDECLECLESEGK